MSAQPKRSSVDEQVRQFYSQQRLPEERAQTVLEAARRRRLAKRRRWYGIAAAVVVSVAMATLLLSTREKNALGDRVAAEVAMGHYKDLEVEFAASSYDDLAQALDKLQFNLAEPSRWGGAVHSTGGAYELVGGRYCSIQAQLAALLKVRDADGGTATLYVTELSPELSSLPGTSRTLDGIEVDVWAERNLLFALARGRQKAK